MFHRDAMEPCIVASFDGPDPWTYLTFAAPHKERPSGHENRDFRQIQSIAPSNIAGIAQMPAELILIVFHNIKCVDDFFSFIAACPDAYRVFKVNCPTTLLLSVLTRSLWARPLTVRTAWAPVSMLAVFGPGSDLALALARQRQVERGLQGDTDIDEAEVGPEGWWVDGDEEDAIITTF
jgi:hypothetical protein